MLASISSNSERRRRLGGCGARCRFPRPVKQAGLDLDLDMVEATGIENAALRAEGSVSPRNHYSEHREMYESLILVATVLITQPIQPRTDRAAVKLRILLHRLSVAKTVRSLPESFLSFRFTAFRLRQSAIAAFSRRMRAKRTVVGGFFRLDI